MTAAQAKLQRVAERERTGTLNRIVRYGDLTHAQRQALREKK